MDVDTTLHRAIVPLDHWIPEPRRHRPAHTIVLHPSVAGGRLSHSDLQMQCRRRQRHFSNSHEYAVFHRLTDNYDRCCHDDD